MDFILSDARNHIAMQDFSFVIFSSKTTWSFIDVHKVFTSKECIAVNIYFKNSRESVQYEEEKPKCKVKIGSFFLFR